MLKHKIKKIGSLTYIHARTDYCVKILKKIDKKTTEFFGTAEVILLQNCITIPREIYIFKENDFRKKVL